MAIRVSPIRSLSTRYVTIRHTLLRPLTSCVSAAFNVFLSQGKLVVDPRFRLFWATSYDVQSMVWMNTPYPPDNVSDTFTPWSLYPPLAHHKHTGEVPVVVHMNDNRKSFIEDWWGEPWFSKPRAMFQDVVRRRVQNVTLRIAHDTGIRTHLLRDICEAHLDLW